MTEAWTQWEGHVVHGGFRLQKYLGGSNHSGVFLAEHHRQVSQQAAIKLIPANSAETSLYLSRWGRAENLSHPHLIRLIDKGRCQLGSKEMLFVAMEYGEENLAEVLPERPLTPAEARDLLEPTLDALAYLHTRGFVHGHLKPANVLAAGGQLKLASDGLCASGEGAPQPGMPNRYDPPEKAKAPASPASDVWSLGMTLAEALTQRLPAWTEAEEGDPIIPESMPAPFLDIVRGCLRQKPQLRLTIAEIASALHPKPQPAQQAIPTKTPSPQQQPQVLKPSQLVSGVQLLRLVSRLEPLRRSLVGPTIIAALTVTVLFGGLGLLRRQPDRDPSPSSATPGKPQVKATGHSAAATALPLSHDVGDTSRSKPSPAPGRHETLPTVLNRPDDDVTTTMYNSEQAGDILREVLPNIPQAALETIHGTVRVGITVRVDPSGNVVRTNVSSRGPSRYFARLAAEAAQHWRFSPSPEKAGREFIVYFAFTNSEAKASATRAP